MGGLGNELVVRRLANNADVNLSNATDVEAVLAGCEQALAGGRSVDLRQLGFWQAVEAVKRRPQWIEEYAERIGAIDRQAFEQTVHPTLPPAVGTLALSSGAAIGLLLARMSKAIPAPWNAATLLAGAAALLGTTHDLAHLAIGRLVGLRFTHWFLNGPTRLQPGLKIDYASYLRTSPWARAWMHASGALVTKLVPFALVPVALRARTPRWTMAILLGIGILQIGTDLLYSVRRSDWKRVRRELRVARELAAKAEETSRV